MSIITNFEEHRRATQAINEAFLVTKRKHKEGLTEYVSTSAPVRTKVLSFIAEKGKVSKSELMEYFNMLEEDLGKKPSWSWLRSNSHLVDSEVSENGDVTYSLTKRGKRILEVYKNYEKLTSAYNQGEEAKKAQIEKAKEVLRSNGIKTLDESEDCPECQEAKFERWYNKYKHLLTETVWEKINPDTVYEAGPKGWRHMFGVCCASHAEVGYGDLSPSCKEFFGQFNDGSGEYKCD